MATDPLNGLEIREGKYEDLLPRTFEVNEGKYLIIVCPGGPKNDQERDLRTALWDWDEGPKTFKEKCDMQEKVIRAALRIVYVEEIEELSFTEKSWNEIYTYLVAGNVPGES